MKNCLIARGFTVRLQTISLLVLLALFAFTAPVQAQDDANSADQSAVVQQILADVNQARSDYGLPPLAANDALMQAAQRHVDDVIANGNWGHYGSDGSNVQMRVARVGYGSSSVSENWVAVSSPEQAIVWWMNDWIHRVNILGGHWDEIGVGAGIASNGFWIFVTDFGNPDGGPPVYVTSSPQGDAGDAQMVMSVPTGGMDYTVEPGDTLLGIAIGYGLDWQDVAIANNMGEEDLLQIGETLRLPSIGGIGGPVEDTTNAVAGKQRYMVVAGDTLFTIALRYDIAWEEIAAVNGLREFDLLQIGQEITLPASLDEEDNASEAAQEATASSEITAISEATASSEDAAAKSASPATVEIVGDRLSGESAPGQPFDKQRYTVRAGDTPLAIALSHSVALDDLLRANDLGEDDFLQIGQTLVMPGAEESSDAGNAAEADLAPSAAAQVTQAAAETQKYTIREGDTVFAVAIRLGVDWQAMLRANNLSEQSLLQPGQILVIP
ncbi:MAG: LysM peptidoglycan-binding domain-containing protein [Caldilinea sp.]